MTPNHTADATNWTPTTAAPGTPEKVAVLIERARLGLPLFHPLDNACGERQQHTTHQPPNKPRSTKADRYITKCKHSAGWVVYVTRQSYRHYVGSFRTFEEAVAARDAFLRESSELELAS